MVINLFGNTAQPKPGQSAGGSDDAIKETTTQTFMADVVEASQSVMVMVDFWAPWCGPCKQLTPILEKVVTATKGAVRLVKMNIDEHPQVAQQMGVQSIPAVFAFKGGRPVDGFMGALTESQIRQFIERVVPEAFAEPENLLEQAQAALDAGDPASAAKLFARLLQEDQGNLEGIGGLARCYIATADYDRAQQTLDMAGPTEKSQTPISGAQAALDLARKSATAKGAIPELRKRLDANADDHEARLELALALNAADDRQGAVDQLIDLMQRDRTFQDDGARQQLVELFEAWGPRAPETIDGRRRLSILLFS